MFKKKNIYRDDDKLYLVRYNLFECKWFSIKIHHILLSDDECQHDHPWGFLSFILWGGYTEHRTFRLPDGMTVVEMDSDSGEVIYEGDKLQWSKKYRVGSIIRRKAEDIHRLVITKPAWTFVITFKKTRQWGFWTPRGWVQWFEYKSTGGHCE